MALKDLRHGMSHTPEHDTWLGMKYRCQNRNGAFWHRYGGRGIKVCERWQTFENFFEDMGYRPSPLHSIDRIDNDGNYEPTNCQWAIKAQQCRNTSQNRLLTFNGKTQNMKDWASEIGIAYCTLQRRLKKGWPVELIFETDRDKLQAYGWVVRKRNTPWRFTRGELTS